MVWLPTLLWVTWQVAVPVAVSPGGRPHPAIVAPPSVNATVSPPGAGLTVAV